MKELENNLDRDLTDSELDKVYYIFKKMSPAAKDAFISMIITKFPNNFDQIITKLGDEYIKNITNA